MEFRLPELGEGIATAVVVSVAAKAGDVVSSGQTLLEVETDKASMPIQAPQDGKIDQFLVKVGDKINVGGVIALFGGAAPSAPVKPDQPLTKPEQPTSTSAPTTASGVVQRADFALPNLGEGIDSGTITAIAVKAGDKITEGQECFTIETDKASMPIPAPCAGTIEEIRVQAGQKVAIGTVLAVLSTSTANVPATATSASVPMQMASRSPVVEQQIATMMATHHATTTGSENGSATSKLPVPAGPATRRFARELGVNLREVHGSARGGRVTIDDVKTHVRNRIQQPATATPAVGATGFTPPPLPDFSKYGPIDKKPFSNLRKKIAENLTIAVHSAPMVTQYDLADITDLEAGRKRIVDALPKGSPKITMTILAIKAVVAALKEYPHFNSSLDLANGELIQKNYYHIGIAVDTERGLVVPVIRDADKKSIRDLARDVTELAEKARTGKLAIDDMRGGTFTITNLGGIGGTAFSPIINYPEVAILGMARSSQQPIVRNGQIEPRLMLPLCLTYDHRVIDGADGARFTSRLVQLFSDPIRLLMES